MKVDNTAPLIIDAINILITDHCEVEKCFRVFSGTAPEVTDHRKTIADQICKALRMHMAIEEEIFYPAVRSIVPAAKASIWDGVIEHDKARVLIEKIEGMEGDDTTLGRAMEELAAIISHHVKEEENDVFPKVINSSLDNEELGKKMLKRKAELSHAIEAEEPVDAGAVSS